MLICAGIACKWHGCRPDGFATLDQAVQSMMGGFLITAAVKPDVRGQTAGSMRSMRSMSLPPHVGLAPTVRRAFRASWPSMALLSHPVFADTPSLLSSTPGRTDAVDLHCDA